MNRPRTVRRDDRGAAIVEFALAAPVLFSLIIGISQMGTLFFANASLQNAVGHGARAAAVFPMPDAEEIEAVMLDSQFAVSGDIVRGEPSVTPGADADGTPWADVSMSYEVPMNFVFFDAPPVTLVQNRRVYTQPDDGTGMGSSAGGSAGSTSTGGTSSTSSTSGGDASTSTSSTSTTSSTGGNNGNGNGNGNGSSGNCRRC